MTPTPTVDAVQYAVDVTLADVDAMCAFLTKQISGTMCSPDSSPAERRFAKALDAATFSAFYAAQKVFDVDDGSALMLHARKERWNELCRVLEQWQDFEGYDTARWQRVTHIDEQQAVKQEAYRAERKAEMAAYYRERL
ncbi:hypothetical protein OHB13_38040 (plasmid) [Streptomyces sp. NBC_00440]|uniref:hypothetical protein n=1 Tax=unclassified Streptomyces TaxID=2593676 RepID=UPI002E1E1F5B|nr:hypothetical protein OG760_37395 [Streptomyces sp. NBC_00963]